MSSSNSVIRRYTPPTCTLEIWAEGSPLSHLMKKTVLNNLHFRLQFDDPQLPEERKICIRGDKEQLEILCTVITNYVQQILQQSAEDFGNTLSNTEPTSISSEPDIESETKDVVAPGFYSPNISSFNTKTPENSPENRIYVEPGENLTHQLFLGPLANQTSGLSIDLTLLQLFDLASALDEYSSDVITLPTLNHQNSRRSLPTWAPIAAVLVVGIGLVPFTWQYAKNLQANQQVAKTTPKNAEIPLTNSPQLDPSLSQYSPNPILPNSVNPSILPTNAPIPPIAVLPQTGVNTSPNLPGNNLPPNTSTTNNAPGKNLPGNNNGNIPINPQYPLSTTMPNSQPQSTIPLSRQNTTLSSSLKTKKIPSSNNKNSPNFSTLPGSVVTVPNRNFSTSNFSKLPNPIPSFSPGILPQGDVAINNINTSNIPVAESSPGVEKADSQKALVAKLREANKTSANSANVNNNQTLFDTPQIAEAREFLQKRWQPPANFSQTLEYSLILGVDGKIERILPLNQPAREYIDKTGIPEIGQPFVSTNKSGQSVKLRVVLSADGKVQTFPE
ncbi:DUF4335 domain-containing protein [Anabaena sp. FACHB-1237]|uniref:DUF4335 domain-containing protein n=1 Tax=Anabaena sp. FACHB-1237 TaxID=2692769 RepID=UPI001680EAA0|nr:DUF4335 domain-containing protein [Anabaena sp. FACHB-1237]MBD2137243.1 DUF4335 domain-containing protein [Anabaena sp. FACHB-1237]